MRDRGAVRRAAHVGHSRRLETPSLRRGGPVRAVADCRRTDLAQHLRPLPGGAHGRSARRCPAPARAARVRPARARCDGEALPPGHRPARCDLRLARRRSQAHATRARCVRSSRRARRAAVRRFLARRALGQLSLAVRARPADREPRRGCPPRGRPTRPVRGNGRARCHGSSDERSRRLASRLARHDHHAPAGGRRRRWSGGSTRAALARPSASFSHLPRRSPGSSSSTASSRRSTSSGSFRWSCSYQARPGSQRSLSSPGRSSLLRSGSSTTATCSSSRESRGSSWRATRCCSRSTCCSPFA